MILIMQNWILEAGATTLGGPALSPMEAAAAIVVARVDSTRFENRQLEGDRATPGQVNLVHVEEVIRGDVGSQFGLHASFLSDPLPAGRAVLFLAQTYDGGGWTTALPLPSMSAYYQVQVAGCGTMVAAGGPDGFAVSTFDDPHQHPTLFEASQPDPKDPAAHGDVSMCESASWDDFLDSVRVGARVVSQVTTQPVVPVEAP